MADEIDWVLADYRQCAKDRDTSDWGAKEERLLGFCHPKQRAFVLDPGRRVCALVARGGGKTTAGRVRFVRRMLRTPRARCLYIANTRQQAIDLMWLPLKDLLEQMGIEARFNETQLTCVFEKNGARLRLVGADDAREIDKLRGQPFHEVGIDESASFDAKLLENLISRVIGPRLGDYRGMLWMIGTPGHILDGPFFKATMVGLLNEAGQPYSRHWDEREQPEYTNWQRWSRHSWYLRDGADQVPAMARLWAEALLEKEQQGWSDTHPIWRREFLGEWCADDTENVYKYRAYRDGEEWNTWTVAKPLGGALVPLRFDPQRKHNPFGLPEGHEWRFVYGMDLGHSDPFALQVFAWAPTSKNLYQVYEFVKRGMYARTIAEHLLGPELDSDSPRGGVLALTGWPDGMVADLSNLGDALRDELANVYGIPCEPAERKNKHDSIELFNGDLVDGRIKVMRGTQLAKEMETLQWDIDEKSGLLKERKGQPNHCTDASIYARRCAYHLFAREAPAARPAKGTPEALELEMKEAEEVAAREFDSFSGNWLAKEPSEDWLSDPAFKDF